MPSPAEISRVPCDHVMGKGLVLMDLGCWAVDKGPLW